MRRSERHSHPPKWSEQSLYDVWPTQIPDTVSGLLLTASLFEQRGDHAKAAQVRKGIKAFEGRL